MKITSPKTFNVSLFILVVACLQLSYVYAYYINVPVSRDFDFGPITLMTFGALQAGIAVAGIVSSLLASSKK